VSFSTGRYHLFNLRQPVGESRTSGAQEVRSHYDSQWKEWVDF